MSTQTLKDFQDQVSGLLLRHRSLLDVLSKLQQSGAAINRSVIKSVTECGCINVRAQKQNVGSAMTLEEARESVDSHVQGALCDHCREVVASEIGRHLFYTASLCNVLQLNLEDIIEQESKKCSTLGLFNLS